MDRINLMPYYGGKAKMSSYIADMLDYRNSKIYVELFGGAGSVILNKIPHDIEIYNELNIGVNTLFNVLKDKEKSIELIDRLMKNSEYSKDCFMDALRYRNSIEDDPLKEKTRLLKEFIKEIQEKYSIDWYSSYKEFRGNDKLLKSKMSSMGVTQSEYKRGFKLLNEYNRIMVDCKGFDVLLLKMISFISRTEYKDDIIDTDIRFFKMLNMVNILECMIKDAPVLKDDSDGNSKWVYAQLLLDEYKSMFQSNITKSFNEYKVKDYDPIELAKSTYIIYQLSRDGIGKYFSNSRVNANNRYMKKISNLLDVSKRLENVIITNMDAKYLLNYDQIVKVISEYGIYGTNNILENDVIMYCDPPYLKEDMLDGNEVRNYTPGLIYKEGDFTYEVHEEFLKLIKNTHYKMIVSNYRDNTHLYDTYLSEYTGWSSIEYETKTTVGSYSNNNRREVLWFNY